MLVLIEYIPYIIVGIIMGVACLILHQKKGYSPVAGFLWGFFFSALGLIVILLEKPKAEHDKEMQEKKGLSILQWLLIFVGVGTLLIILFFVFLSLSH